MKKLILVRHGKSSWKHDLPDYERPLKERAIKDAGLVIKAVKGSLEEPFVLWSSFATRALESARMFKEQLDVEEDNFLVRKDLYTFDSGELIDVIRSCDDSLDQLMVFGHNPAITETANRLGDQYFDNVPTTGLVVMEFETESWRSLEKGSTILYLFPKNLR